MKWHVAGILLLLPAAGGFLSAADLAPAAVKILEQRCHGCHNARMQMAGVLLGSTAEVSSVKDRLIAAIAYTGKVKMPPTGALSAGEAKTLTDWVLAGAPRPAGSAASPRQPRPMRLRGGRKKPFASPNRPLVPPRIPSTILFAPNLPNAACPPLPLPIVPR